jgi:hypothetical protein
MTRTGLSPQRDLHPRPTTPVAPHDDLPDRAVRLLGALARQVRRKERTLAELLERDHELERAKLARTDLSDAKWRYRLALERFNVACRNESATTAELRDLALAAHGRALPASDHEVESFAPCAIAVDGTVIVLATDGYEVVTTIVPAGRVRDLGSP